MVSGKRSRSTIVDDSDLEEFDVLENDNIMMEDEDEDEDEEDEGDEDEDVESESESEEEVSRGMGDESEEDGFMQNGIGKDADIEDLQKDYLNLRNQEQDILKNLKRHKHEDVLKGQAVKNQKGCLEMSTTDSTSSKKSNARSDPCWKYVKPTKPPLTNDLMCNFCDFVSKGGINRAKYHIVGGHTSVHKCPKCSPHVVEEIGAYLQFKKQTKVMEEVDITNLDSFGDDETELDDFGEPDKSGRTKSIHVPKKPKTKGPKDVYFTPDAEKAVKDRKLRQTTINEACKKELRGKACEDIARWMYDAAIPFNVVNYPSFAVMLESVGQYGVGLKPPTMHEVRVPLLNKEVNKVRDEMKSYEEEWAKYGCSIMSDGWTDKRQRTLINFLVNSHKGTVFIESVDASDYSKTGEKLFELFDRMVERVGEKNVVQFITDSAASNVLAGKLLMAKRPNLYWTPCAAHCIDLILEDIGKLPVVQRTIKKAMKLNSYIYTRPGVVNLLRKFTNHRELVRAGITRFATVYLTLHRMHLVKALLKKMFVSEDWTKSKWAKENSAKTVVGYVLSITFWTDIVYILKLFGPLVSVLRLVDGEKMPPMGYIHEAMKRAKEAIATSFKNEEERYENVFAIIDERWKTQLKQPLHGAGKLLNPAFFNAPDENGEIRKGFYQALERLVESEEEIDKINEQLSRYHNCSKDDVFGMKTAVRQRTKIDPVEWWKSFGGSLPQLQKFAIKVLSLTYSASGCERNWSIFEHVHSKKRNRLAQKRMNDLVFVKYNRALKNRKGVKNVISLNDIDDSNEWLTGRMEEDISDDDEFVFEDDDLTWDVVARASGVEEDAYRTRGKGKSSTTIPRAKPTKTYVRGGTGSSSRSKDDNRPQVVREEVHEKEDDDDEYQVEEEESKDDEDMENLDDDIDMDVDEELDLEDDV